MGKKLSDFTNEELEIEFESEMREYTGTVLDFAHLVRRALPRYFYIRIIKKMKRKREELEKSYETIEVYQNHEND